MTSVILCCQCVQVLPLSPRQPGVTKVLPLSPGWAGLGRSCLRPRSVQPRPAKMAAVSWRSAEQRAALLSVLSGHYIVTCCTHPHTLSSVLLTTTRYSRVSISSTAGDTAQVSSVLSPEPRWHGHNKAQAAE